MYIVDYILSRRQVLKSCPWHYRKYLEKKNIHFKRRSNQIIIFINMYVYIICIYMKYVSSLVMFRIISWSFQQKNAILIKLQLEKFLCLQMQLFMDIGSKDIVCYVDEYVSIVKVSSLKQSKIWYDRIRLLSVTIELFGLFFS